MLLQQAADRVRDLLAAAIADGDVDVQAAAVRGRCRGLLEDRRRAGGQQVERTDRVYSPPLSWAGQLGHHLLDHLEQRL